MVETFSIYYEQENGWVFLIKVEDTLVNVLEQVYNYPQDKKYRLERETQFGSQIINFE